MNKYYSLVVTMTNEDLNDLIEAIKRRRNELAKKKTKSFNVGDSVWFMHSIRRYVGTIKKVNRTTITVDTNFGTYRVPANLLNRKED